VFSKELVISLLSLKPKVFNEKIEAYSLQF